MDAQSISTILVTVVTVLGSASAWKYYERRSMRREKAEDYLKDDCRERITKLEALLEKAALEKDKMRFEILELTKQLSELRIKVQFLGEEKEHFQKIANSKSKKEPINKAKKPTKKAVKKSLKK